MQSQAGGLSQRQAEARLRSHGPNELRSEPVPSLWRGIGSRLANPLIVVLLCASVISAFTGDAASFGFVAVIVVMSIALDMGQEHRAGHAVKALQQTVALTTTAWRSGHAIEIPARELVPGDCVELSAGRLVPADGRVLASTHLFVNQAALTGEAYPVEKRRLESAAESLPVLECEHAVFMGSTVVGGTARVLICATGTQTEFGRIARTLSDEPPPTAFERGTRRFGWLLTRATMALVLFVMLINTLHERPLLESFIFAVALAVGLAPELLPMIVSVTLARGAVRMSRSQVIVKRLGAVQDLGAMDVLCTDKTGTLTEATLRVDRVFDAQGHDSAGVFEMAWLNSHFETGLRSGMDEAILARGEVDVSSWRKLDEVPFDFERRRVSVLLARDGKRLLIVKGAPEEVLRLSTGVDTDSGVRDLENELRARLLERSDAQGGEGLRLLAVATRWVEDGTSSDVSAADEHDLVFAGFIAFSDLPKWSTAPTVRSLHDHGIALKIVTGDSESVTRHLCALLHLKVDGVLTGSQIAGLDDAGLRAAVRQANLFCRVTPEQKNRIVRALQAAGHVVGYLGDGINDAPPLHSADVGISVDSAVDVAKQSADLVLLRHDLTVLRDGIREGRRALVNVNKYVLMATSSNFGNMVSMASATLFLPFLPMRPVQILLNNFLYDASELAIPTDRVSDADLLVPQRWDTALVRNFMLCFGPLSSLFDLSAFFLLYGVLHTQAEVFQTAWFVQSMATQVLVIFVIRTTRPCWRDRPSAWMTASSIAVVALSMALPFLPWSEALGFVPLSAEIIALVIALTVTYLIVAEVAKHVFYRFSRTTAKTAGVSRH